MRALTAPRFNRPSMYRLISLLCLFALMPLTGCAVVTVAGAAAGAAISVTGAVVSTGIQVTGAAVEAGIDAIGDDDDEED